MKDGDSYEVCGTCGTEFLQRTMRQVTTSGIFLCLKCYEADVLRSDDGLMIDDCEDDEWDEEDWSEEETTFVREPICIGSCDVCGSDVYDDEPHPGSIRCDQCEWMASQE